MFMGKPSQRVWREWTDLNSKVATLPIDGRRPQGATSPGPHPSLTSQPNDWPGGVSRPLDAQLPQCLQLFLRIHHNPTEPITALQQRGFHGPTLTAGRQCTLYERWTTNYEIHPHEAFIGLAANATRSDTGRRPGYRCRRSCRGGSDGAMRSQSSSGTRSADTRQTLPAKIARTSRHADLILKRSVNPLPQALALDDGLAGLPRHAAALGEMVLHEPQTALPAGVPDR